MTDTVTDRRRDHHGLSPHEVVLLLETDPADGLTSTEAAARLRRYGQNVLPTSKPDRALARLLRQLNHPLVLVLLVAGAVTLVLGEPVDSSVIFGVVLLNTVVGYLQESKAQAALEALRGLVRTEARTVRDGDARYLPDRSGRRQVVTRTSMTPIIPLSS